MKPTHSVKIYSTDMLRSALHALAHHRPQFICTDMALEGLAVVLDIADWNRAEELTQST